MMYMKGRTRNYPVIFEKTTLGNYRIIFPDLNMKFDEETLPNCRIIAKLYMERIQNMYQNIGQVFLKINLRNYF